MSLHHPAGPAPAPRSDEYAARAVAQAARTRRLAQAGHNELALEVLVEAVDFARRATAATPATIEALAATGAAFASIDIFGLGETGDSTLRYLVRRDAVPTSPTQPALRVVPNAVEAARPARVAA